MRFTLPGFAKTPAPTPDPTPEPTPGPTPSPRPCPRPAAAVHYILILEWTSVEIQVPLATPVATKLSLKRVRAKALQPVACARQVVRA